MALETEKTGLCSTRFFLSVRSKRGQLPDDVSLLTEVC